MRRNMRGFSPAELEEMRLADEEIERTFRMTNKEFRRQTEFDREALMAAKDSKQKAIAESQRQYRERNKADKRHKRVENETLCEICV